MNKAQAELEGGLEALSDIIPFTSEQKLSRQAEEIKKLGSKNFTLIEDYRKLKKEHDRQKKGYEVSVLSCLELEEDVEGLVKERDEWKEAHAKVEAVAHKHIEHIHELETATNGHTPENLKEIMRLAPTAEGAKGKMIKACPLPTAPGTIAISYTLDPIVEHKEPKLIYCLQTPSGEWVNACGSNARPIKRLRGGYFREGVEHDLIVDDKGNVWFGHWNDGIKKSDIQEASV